MAHSASHWQRLADLVELETENPGHRIFVTVNRNSVDGFTTIDVRSFWQDTAGAWHASKKGLSMSIENWVTVVAIIQSWLDDAYESGTI
jgi:hypothetical protein